MLKTALRASLLLAFVFTLPACDSDEPDPVIPPGTPPAVDPTGAFTAARANLGQWTFVPVGGAKCRDGSDTGFGVRLQEGATDLMVYLQGGGACFNASTCQTNPSSYGAAEFATQANLNDGILSTAESNPVGDWNAVFVPYCTGDIHGGSAPGVTLPGGEALGEQQFVGHLNIEAYLDLMEPYFGDPNKVLLAGSSAGGFGSLVNFPAVDESFSDSQTYLLDDSGPIFFDDTVLSPQLGGGLSLFYGFAQTIPEAPSVLQPDGLQNIYSYLATTYPESRFALTSYLQDPTIRFFFGFGQPDQTITADEYAAGLRDVRDRLPSEWGTYFANGEVHTFLLDSDRYNGTSGGVALNTYVGALVNGTVSNVDVSPVRPALTPRLLAGR